MIPRTPRRHYWKPSPPGWKCDMCNVVVYPWEIRKGSIDENNIEVDDGILARQLMTCDEFIVESIMES